VKELWIHPDVETDLATLDAVDPDAADYFWALFEQIESDPALIGRLNHDDYGGGVANSFDVGVIESFQRAGRNIWRLKVWNHGSLIGHRVIYGFDEASEELYVLGVVAREHCYDSSHPRVKQLFRAYSKLIGGPTIK
jgi:hypothetical protein